MASRTLRSLATFVPARAIAAGVPPSSGCCGGWLRWLLLLVAIAAVATVAMAAVAPAVAVLKHATAVAVAVVGAVAAGLKHATAVAVADVVPAAEAKFGHLTMMRVAVKQQQAHSRSAPSRCLQIMFRVAPSLIARGCHQPQACCLLSLGRLAGSREPHCK